MEEMFSYALSTGTNLATNYFHLPFDEEEDADIENYEKKFITWVAEPSGESKASSSTSVNLQSSSESSSPSSSSPSSPSSLSSSLSPSSSTSSISSSTSSATSVSTSPDSPSQPRPEPTQNSPSKTELPTLDDKLISTILADNDLYSILGVTNSPSLDKMTLRRAYLARSKSCHPDKFPDNPSATHAFQKVAVAYDVLSTPSLRRLYDDRSPSSPYDVFAARPTGYAEETFRGVMLGVFNDFLDGDLEVIRTLLKSVNDINPGIRLGEDGINSVLASLHAIRERALTCRTCITALQTELTRLLEVQHAFRELSYFDILGRSRLAIQLTRITLSLPIALERALMEDGDGRMRKRRTRAGGGCEEYRERGRCFHFGTDGRGGKCTSVSAGTIFPRQVVLLIRGVDIALEKMERILK